MSNNEFGVKLSFLNLNSYIGNKVVIKSSGSLSESPFYTILAKISQNRFSGKLVLSKGDRIKHVYFDKGNPISMKSNLVAESLYSVISRSKMLSKERMTTIIKDIEQINFLENLDFEQKLFMYLKEKDYLSMDDLNRALKQQFKERFMNLYGWFSGEYSFEKDSHLIYNISPQAMSLKEINALVENLLYPDRAEGENIKGLKEIEGNFKENFFPELLSKLIESGATGKLVMQRKDRTKVLRIHYGVPVSVSSDHPSEKIGKLMVRTGLLKIDQWMKLEDETKFIKSDVCEIALKENLVKQSDIRIIKALSFVERLLELFSWRSGLYRFERRKSIKCPSCATQIQIKFDLDPYNYACPKCRAKLAFEPSMPVTEVFRTENEKRVSPLRTISKQDYRKSTKEDTITGKIPEKRYCTDCGKPLDPVIKKCTCCDETLLDAYQLRDIKKQRKEYEEEDSIKSAQLKPLDTKSEEKSQFDILASNLIALSSAKSMQVICFTGPSQKSGKSFVTLNSALSLCENFSKKVLLIDASFARPSLSLPLELKPEFDLQDSASGDITFSQALYETSYDNLYLLPLKCPIPKPDLFFEKEALDKMLEYLKSEFNFIFIDSGVFSGSQFENYLFQESQGIVLVLRKGYETKRKTQGYLSRLNSSKIVGTVLNRID